MRRGEGAAEAARDKAPKEGADSQHKTQTLYAGYARDRGGQDSGCACQGRALHVPPRRRPQQQGQQPWRLWRRKRWRRFQLRRPWRPRWPRDANGKRPGWKLLPLHTPAAADAAGALCNAGGRAAAVEGRQAGSHKEASMSSQRGKPRPLPQGWRVDHVIPPKCGGASSVQHAVADNLRPPRQNQGRGEGLPAEEAESAPCQRCTNCLRASRQRRESLSPR